MSDAIIKALHSIAEDILSLVHLILDENGLKNSALKDETRCAVEASGNPVFSIIFNDYIDYLENGRSSDSGNAPPISVLRDWALLKGIPTTNDVLYAIAETIKRQGTAPRPILAMLEHEIDDSFNNQWADQLFEIIIKEVEVFFNN